jgi:AraC-like DNA-binding protein
VSDKYKCLSVLYDLLSYVSRLDGRDRSKNRKFALIEPALEYLKSHIYSPALRIEKLHKLSGISDTYFRQIFTERFGVSPQQYVLTLRIRHAHSIIESGDFDTVAEVAETVGYTDPLYFSKAYKKYYGFPPSETFK